MGYGMSNVARGRRTITLVSVMFDFYVQDTVWIKECHFTVCFRNASLMSLSNVSSRATLKTHHKNAHSTFFELFVFLPYHCCLPRPVPVMLLLGQPPHVEVGLNCLRTQDVFLVRGGHVETALNGVRKPIEGVESDNCNSCPV
jgi:hypothetical protein